MEPRLAAMRMDTHSFHCTTTTLVRSDVLVAVTKCDHATFLKALCDSERPFPCLGTPLYRELVSLHMTRICVRGRHQSTDRNKALCTLYEGRRPLQHLCWLSRVYTRCYCACQNGLYTLPPDCCLVSPLSRTIIKHRVTTLQHSRGRKDREIQEIYLKSYKGSLGNWHIT
jgi:hypothetical protein